MFQIGKIYHRQSEIHDKYGGNRQAGIASSRDFPYIFLFSSPRGEEYGYRDGWISASEYLYTGEGQTGDMVMVRGNRAVHDHRSNGKEIHLFEQREKGFYEYLGEFEYISHKVETGKDAVRRKRKIIVFQLSRV